MGRTDHNWTPARMVTAKAMWLAGQSANLISKALGGVTRNGVIGMVHREGWTRTAEVAQKAAAAGSARGNRVQKAKLRPAYRGSPEHKRRAAAARATAEKIIAAANGPADASTARPWLTRQLGECANLVQGTGADALACCAPVGHDSPDWQYCPACRAAMFTKPSASTKDLERSVRRKFAA
jgi:GcrA cell cycle regulator